MVGRAAAFCVYLALIGAATTALAAPVRHPLVTRQSVAGEVHIDVTVRGKGPLVILIPSLGRGGADFDDLARSLARAGFTTAAVDPRGIGGSTGPMTGQTLADYGDDVDAVARALSPNKPAILVGHAFGNRVARATAAGHPEVVRRLILLAAGGQVAPAPDIAKALADVFDDSLSPAQHLAAVQKGFFAPGNDPDVWRGGWYPAVARAQRAALAATGPDSWRGAGSAPILIIQAADDLIAPPANADALRAAYPDRVTVAPLPHAGHAMLPEQPEAIAAILVRYLKDARP